MKLEFYQINAFTTSFNGGNPAGVCPLKKWIDDKTMQTIARENGYSETAFFVPVERGYELRWFTPGCEVNLCGHATLATAYVLSKELKMKNKIFRFFTKSGEITVAVDDDLFTLNMPSNKLKETACPEKLIQAIEKKPDDTFLAEDYMLIFDDENFIKNLRPNFLLMQEVTEARGIIVTAPSCQPGVDFVSRWFGSDAVKVDEDPVTGSAHCSLIPYWSSRLSKTKLHALQISDRGGELFCEDKGERVLVAGNAVKYIKGEITI